MFGEQPSAAKWNILGTNDASFNDGTGIADGAVTSEKLTSTISFRAYHNGTQSLASGSYAVIQFNAEDYDTGSDFDTSTYKFVAPKAGIYHFDGRLNWTAMGAQDWSCALYKNGSVINYGQFMSGAADEGGNSSTTVNCNLKLAANDEIKLYGYVATSARTVRADSTLCYFSGHFVGVG